MANKHKVRGIRGATTSADNIPEEIYIATRELLTKMVDNNAVETADIAAVFFSATPDLDSAFPAKAAREIGWLKVPLFCHVEINVPDSISRCIRILMMVNTGLEQDQINHVYLKDTVRLRDI
jgi:chorismate mutase